MPWIGVCDRVVGHRDLEARRAGAADHIVRGVRVGAVLALHGDGRAPRPGGGSRVHGVRGRSLLVPSMITGRYNEGSRPSGAMARPLYHLLPQWAPRVAVVPDMAAAVAATSPDVPPAHGEERALDRRRFLLASGGTLSAALLAACGSRGPRSAQRILNSPSEGTRAWSGRCSVIRRWMKRASTRWTGARPFPVLHRADGTGLGCQGQRAVVLEVSGMVAKADAILARRSPADSRGDAAHRPLLRRRLAGDRVVDRRPPSRRGRRGGRRIRRRGTWISSRSTTGTTRAGTSRVRRTRRRWSPTAWTVVPGAAHGGPARVHSPVKLGYKNTKYLTRIVFMPGGMAATGATRDTSGTAAFRAD